MKKSVLLFLIQLVCSFLFAQNRDTVDFASRSEFNQFVDYDFMESSGGLTCEIRKKVRAIYKKYDFTGNEYDCQYRFDFLVELDSCGNILNCSNSNNSRLKGDLLKFEEEVRAMIVESKEQLFNQVVLSDITYFYSATIFVFDISCSPDEIIFNNNNNEKSDQKKRVYRFMKDSVIFTDFVNCQRSSN